MEYKSGKISPTDEEKFQYVSGKEPLPPINGAKLANGETASSSSATGKDEKDKKKEKDEVVGFFELDQKEHTTHSNLSSVDVIKILDEEVNEMEQDNPGQNTGDTDKSVTYNGTQYVVSGLKGGADNQKKVGKENKQPDDKKSKNGAVLKRNNSVEPLKEKHALANGSNGVIVDTIPAKGKDGKSETDGKEEKEKTDEEVTGFFELFKYSSKRDVLFMVLGSIAAMINGSAFPLMIIVFGEMIDIFVISGEYSSTVDYMQSLGILSSLGFSAEQVIKDPELLKPHYAQILTDSNNTVNTGTIDKAIDNDLLEVMRKYAVYYIAIGGGAILMGYLQVSMWMIASERQTHHIRKLFYRNILRQNIGWFDTQESGELNTRISGDISTIHDGIGDKCGSFCQWTSGAIIGIIIGFVYGWELTLVTIAVSPLLVGAAAITTKLVAMASGAELKAYAAAGAIAEEVLGAVRTVVAFGGQQKESERYDKQLTHARDLGIRKGMINGVALGSVWLIVFVTYGFGFWYGAKKVREDPEDYTIGNVTLVFFSIVMAAFSLGNASPAIQSIGKARGAAFKIYQLIEQDPPIDSFSEEGMQPDRFNGTVELRNVHFTYPSRPDVKILKGVSLKIERGQTVALVGPSGCGKSTVVQLLQRFLILKGVSLKIERGQTVALVGPSGCGKSTVVQLLQRFYDPESGQVLIDGMDMKDVNVRWIRQHIGIVSQEPILFGTTIAENIRYGGDDVSDAMIEEATKMANAYDFIMELPDKFETLVGERGAQLSGGQKQRIAIARALVRDPKILLLDEATSALDTESEGIVQEALEKASHGRTTIVIAHRLSTIKTADMIAGFKDGLIVEKGTHDELMRQGGIYNQLVTLQTKTTDEDIEAELYSGQKPALKKQMSKHISVTETNEDKGEKTEEDKKAEEEQKKKEADNAGLGRVMKMNGPEWYFIALGCFGALLNGGVMPAFAILFAEMLGVFSEPDADKQEEEVRFWVIMFVVVGCGSFCTYFLQGSMFGRSGEHLTLRLRSRSFKAILRQDIAFFDDHSHSVGALTTRLATDAAQVQGAAGARIGQSIMSIASITAGLVIAFVYSWKMTLVILGFVPFLMIGGFLQMTMLQGAAGKNKEALEAAGKVAVESIENIRTVASLTKEPVFIDKFMEELQQPYQSAMKKAHVVGVSFSFSQGVMFFCYAACFYFGAYLISENELDYVEVFKVFAALVFSAMSVGEASSFAPDAAKAQASAIEIFKLLDREPAIDSYSEDGTKPAQGSYTASVTFSDVKFRYPTRKDVTVLKGLNITVSPGQTVALVGSSGCGKSTTIQLIERFYDAEDGNVYLDSHKITDLNIGWLRSQIGIVSQEPILFDRSIAENIAYGDNSREVQMDEIITAARNANIHQFISSLPDGYETNVGEKGAQLSGGQKQRVAIARALLRNPKILLLDEATSALDTESEKIVQEALDQARAGRTSIVIAHRLSTIQNADKIYVIRSGVVTEEGTHSQLMSKQGFYFKLHQAQGRKS